MELNTSVWGEGVAPASGWISENSANVQLASVGENRASWTTLVSLNKIALNEYIDDSLYWCVTKSNNPISKYGFYFLHRPSGQASEIQVSKILDGGQVNFFFNLSRWSSNGLYQYNDSYANLIRNNFCIGFNRTGSSDNRSDIYPIIRIGRRNLILLCKVYYITNMHESDGAWYFDNYGDCTLDEFINNNSLYNNPTVGIYKITFEVYHGYAIVSGIGSRTTSNIILTSAFKHKSPKQIMGNSFDFFENIYNWGDLDWKPTEATVAIEDYLATGDVNEVFHIGGTCSLSNYCDTMMFRAPCVDSKWEGKMFGNIFFTLLTDHTDLMNQFHKIAHAGLFYTDKASTATDTDLTLDEPTDEHLYWGIVTNGYATGKYGQGGTGKKLSDTNPDLINSTDPDVDPDFNGNDDTDTTDYIDDTPLESPKLSTVGVFNRTYAMTANQLMILADDLWNADLTKFEEIIEGLGLMGENPMNGLIDCRLYPFDITKLLPVFQSESIVLGRTVMQAMGYKLSNDLNAIIDLGECDFRPYFNKQYYSIDAPSYLDYSPYTEARLYIPYCGFIPIDTAEFMGHHITAKMVIDVVTGTCCAIVWKDGIIAIKANGVVGVSIPMTGTDSATYAMTVTQGLISGSVQIASGVGKIVAGGIGTQTAGTSLMKSSSGGVNASGAYGNNSFSTSQFSRDTNSFGRRDILRDQGATGQIINGAWQLHQAAATPVQYAQAGSASPSCETWLPQYPYFIVDRTVPEIPFNYGHTVGFACFVNEQLSMFSGFTICSNVDTSGFSQATESERAELKMLLESGVFLPVSN